MLTESASGSGSPIVGALKGMDRLLEVWLAARVPRDPTIGPDPVAARTLHDELLRLTALTTRELDAKLARLQADVGDFREEAEWITRSVPEAEQLLKELELVAAHRTHHADDEPVAAALDHRPERREDPPKTTNDPTETAREAVLALLREHPDRSWAPQLAYDELRRRGRGFARTAVQTALQRMAADGRFVKRVRPGAYQAVLDSAHAANGHVSERWLTPELLQQLAEDTGSRFVANHPGAADHDDLVAEAKRRVEVWIERHDGGEPDNEAHLRRLMKTALDDYYRRLRRNGSKPGTNVGVEEVRLR